VSEISSGPGDLNYRNLLWEVLDASTELEKVHQDLKTVQGHVTGATEVVDLGVIHDRLAEISTVFGQVRGRAQAASYYAGLTSREPLQLSELAERNVNAALAMLPDIAGELALIAEIVVHIADAAVPVPPDKR
jgi:hypothetical protein